MLAVDVVIQVTLVVVTSVFGAMVLLAGPRRAPNLALAAFLFLLAGNQAIESLRRLLGDPNDPILWIASVFAALDPLVLYVFVAIYPTRNALDRNAPLALVAGTSALLAIVAGWQGALGIPLMRVWLATTAFTAIVYSVLFASLVRRARSDDPSPALRLLLPAFAIAAIPTWARFAEPVYSLATVATPALGSSFVLLATPVILLVVVLASLAAWRIPRERRTPLAWGVAAGAILGVPSLVRIAQDSGVTRVVGDADALALSWAAVAIRWLAFGALVSAAVIRYDYLGVSMRARRRAARAIVAGGLLATAGLVLASARAALADAWLPITIAEILVLGAILIVSQGFRGMVDRLAARVYGVPLPGDVAASLDAYRAAAAAAAGEGRGVDARLAQLREELELDPRSAGVIESAVFGRERGLAPGALVAGRFRVERALGRGSEGRAYLATDREGRALVLKDVGHRAQAPLAEVRAASALRHPNVLALLDVVEEERRTILVTEYASGGDLEEHLGTNGRFDEPAGIALLLGILEGLAHIHRAGIVHRDLKPSNILLDAHGRPKIADLGLARLRDEATAAPGHGAIAGTPAFLAPEVRRGEPATPASDVYAVALVARRVLKPPLGGPLAAVVARAASVDADARYADAKDMLEAMRAASAAIGIDARDALAGSESASPQ